MLEWTTISNGKFTGYERDAAAGLDFAQARHYSYGRGRFTQPDPIGLKGANQNHPESLNRYTYVLNDPINGVDPTGLLTLILGGFTAGDATWGQKGTPFWQAITDTFGEEAEVWEWYEDGLVDLSILSLYQGVVDEGGRLARFINSYSFKEGEKLNIVAHSYGGNVVKAAMPDLNRQIDNLVTLGTPQNYDLVARGVFTRPDKVKNHCNVSSLADLVQVGGGGVGQLAAIAYNTRSAVRWFTRGLFAYYFGYYQDAEYAFWLSAEYTYQAFLWTLTTRIDPLANKNVLLGFASHGDLHTPAVWNNVKGACGV